MKRIIIAITREYGSGGRIIGEMAARELGIPFYDRQMIALTASKSGFSQSVVEHSQQKKTNSLLYGMYMTEKTLPINDQVFIAQNQVIQDLAEKGSCVIVGRCADYVLRDDPQCLRVFIHAPLADRVRRVEDVYCVKEPKTEAHVRKVDKDRASYYNHFTHQQWGDIRNYHLCIDSSIGLDKSVALICQLAK